MLLFSARLALIATLIISCGTTYPVTDTGNTTNTGSSSKTTTTYNAEKLQADILLFVNRHRASIGKPALQEVNSAESQAEVHSANMAGGRTAFSHDGFDQRIAVINKDLGGGVSSAAENVAFGQMSAREVVDGWLKSPGHKKNIEGNYNLTGIGTARNNKGVIYFTQIFLRK